MLHLKRVFQVDPKAAWLKDEIDDTAYFPTDDGYFNVIEPSQSL